MTAIKLASFGSISHGTLRIEDLLDAFAYELEYRVQQNAHAWASPDERQRRDAYLDLVYSAREIDFDSDAGDVESDAAYLIVDRLTDSLQSFAPRYAYFGAHPGDGSDFGYWLSEFFRNEFDGLTVSDTSEIPGDYVGEALHINDHGNMTLYDCDGAHRFEVWSAV